MVMQLEQAVPFGRSLDEYKKMFNLSRDELTLNILGVADGPASFNAELTELGGRVVSVDPIYTFSATQIEEKYQSVVNGIIEQVRNTPEDWVWSYHKSPDQLRANRDRVTQRFVQDFGKKDDCGRYVSAELPVLPFADNEFELALCSHFLFLYSSHFSYEFHKQSIEEMLRVAGEVRIFPLLTLMLEPSPYLDPIAQSLTAAGHTVEFCRVDYELQKGGHTMMVVRTVNA